MFILLIGCVKMLVRQVGDSVLRIKGWWDEGEGKKEFMQRSIIIYVEGQPMIRICGNYCRQAGALIEKNMVDFRSSYLPSRWVEFHLLEFIKMRTSSSSLPVY